MVRYFFFYGTLIGALGCPVAKALRGALAPCGPGSMRGALYALDDPAGWYPALLPGRSIVRGVLYQRTERFDAALLTQLDVYEGFDPRRPVRSDYVRRSALVRRAGGGAVMAQLYWFRAELPQGAQALAQGDFCRWIAQTGNRPFGG